MSGGIFFRVYQHFVMLCGYNDVSVVRPVIWGSIRNDGSIVTTCKYSNIFFVYQRFKINYL